MESYAGLDVSMDKTHLCIMDRDGAVLLETSCASDVDAIAAELAAVAGCRRIVLETGRLTTHLHHGLAGRGLPVVCIESRHAHQTMKSMTTHKTDRNDARGLAHLARTGFFKQVHVKSPTSHGLRALLVARKKLVGQRVDMEGQVRGLMLVFGVRLPRSLTRVFVQEAQRASRHVPGLAEAVRSLLAARGGVLAAISAIDGDIRRLSRDLPACQLLITVPGVGPLTALAFVAAVDEPARFGRSRDLGAYLGLVPKRHQSGEIDYSTGISKRGDGRVRTMLYEAANVMLTRYRGDLKLKTWALGVATRSSMQVAWSGPRQPDVSEQSLDGGRQRTRLFRFAQDRPPILRHALTSLQSGFRKRHQPRQNNSRPLGTFFPRGDCHEAAFFSRKHKPNAARGEGVTFAIPDPPVFEGLAGISDAAVERDITRNPLFLALVDDHDLVQPVRRVVHSCRLSDFRDVRYWAFPTRPLMASAFANANGREWVGSRPSAKRLYPKSRARRPPRRMPAMMPRRGRCRAKDDVSQSGRGATSNRSLKQEFLGAVCYHR
jgi:transposase